MNRGSMARTLGRACPSARFNEAPIHESGKSRSTSTRSRKGGRFNEAPIHESGKCDHAVRHGRRGGASMRPRFMNRGSQEASFGSATALAELQ